MSAQIAGRNFEFAPSSQSQFGDLGRNAFSLGRERTCNAHDAGRSVGQSRAFPSLYNTVVSFCSTQVYQIELYPNQASAFRQLVVQCHFTLRPIRRNFQDRGEENESAGYGNGRPFFAAAVHPRTVRYMVEKTHIPGIGSKFIRTKFRTNFGYMDFYKPITTVRG